jgi:hypothetical protein
MSPSEFEFLINMIGKKISTKFTAFRKATSIQGRLALTLRFDKFYDTFLSPLRFTITKRSRNRTTLQIRATFQDRSIKNKKKNREVNGDDESR